MDSVSDEGQSGRELFLAAAGGEATPRPPVWLMRQAGRYLPEYRAIREEHSFVEAISTPDIATEISLQPWDRFRPDGIVMYSDILVALEPLGFSYHIEPGVGPVVENPVSGPGDLEREKVPVETELSYVGTLLDRLGTRLQGEAAVIGFVGGPFTLAAYAVQGEPSRSFMRLRRLRAEHPDTFRQLLERIGDVLESFVRFQVTHGADVIQLFDTYAGLLSPEVYRDVLAPIQRRVLAASDVPTIVFARNMGGRLEQLKASGADVIGLDWTVELGDARSELEHDTPVQGNLDPSELFGTPDRIADLTNDIIDAGGGAGHILNLGHGVHKSTPVAGVETFVETAKSR